MLRLRPALIVAACAALAACAATQPSVPAPAPQAAADPPQTVDGLYIGTSTRFQADRRQCPHPGLVKLEVLNGQFQYRWDYRTYVDSSIDPQNEVHGQAENITLVGHLKGRRMEGDVTNGWCGLHFTVARRNS
jgi:hypothetical protein